MISLSLESLAATLGTASVDQPAVTFTGVAIDSRGECDGRLFVALRGPNFDGHQFVAAAHDRGAVAALVEKPLDCAIPQVQVCDCKQAMARLANYWRHRCKACVIALTGSNGKTTVKEMLYRILHSRAETLATRGNLNNDIGVPLTLCELEQRHEFAIIEMGANHRGEIAVLADIAEPDIVYVNNAAAAHLAGFGGLQGVIESKGELYAYCAPAQRALFNVDESASDYWQEICAAETRMTCGLDHAADVRATWAVDAGQMRIEFGYRGETCACRVGVLGEHNVRNALAAVSLALLAGLDLATAVAGLEGFSGVRGRLQLLTGPARSRLIDDSYNANPDSLEAGIRVLCALDGSAWLALGDMAELGDEAAELHRHAAMTARDLGVEKMFGLGEMSCLACEQFGDDGQCCDSIEQMADAILGQIHPGVNLLVKGSRAAGMERLVARLAEAQNGGEAGAV